MDRKLHVWTLVSGLILTAWGISVLGDGVGWWDLELADLRYAGPILVIVIGTLVVVGALMSTRRTDEGHPS